jgi:membrane fusion protein, heavy metal efflux system
MIFMAGCHHHTGDHHHDHEEEEGVIGKAIYSDDFELFAEFNPFVVGHESTILAHFTHLPGFTPLERGNVSVKLVVEGTEVYQALDSPTRPGIFVFRITPKQWGKGELQFTIVSRGQKHTLTVSDVRVFKHGERIPESLFAQFDQQPNVVQFTKEQSWKTGFATGYPQVQPIGQVIRSTARVQAHPGNETVVSSTASGIIRFGTDILLSGTGITTGRELFIVTGGDLADNNFGVTLSRARSDYERSRSEYERAQALAQERIVSEKDLIASRQRFQDAEATYNNLLRNSSAAGRIIKSPITGYVKQLLVAQGEYVELGQPLAIISQNHDLILTAEVPQRYLSQLSQLHDANIRPPGTQQIYSLDQVNGRIVSYGKATIPNHHLIPVNIRIDNPGEIIPGGIVEVFLLTRATANAIVVPNTALLEEQGIFFLWVQLTPEQFEKREVAVGITDGRVTEIIKGITSEERIVTRGAMMVRLAQSTASLDAHSGHVH